MADKKQIPGLPVATEAKDNDRLIKRDMDSGSDESLEVSLLDDRANARGFAQSVDSVSTLRTSTFPTSLERLWLSGYYGVGTAGGGPLYRDSADTTTADNGGTVFVDGDGVRWRRNFDSEINILWTGAKNDGSEKVNDYFASAQAALPDSGGSIYVPAGVYLGTVRLTKENVTLHGDQRASRIVIEDDIGTSTGDTSPVIILAEGCRVHSLFLDGNGQNQPNVDDDVNISANRYDGVDVYASDAVVEDNYIYDVKGHGVIIWTANHDENVSEGPRYNIKVRNNFIENCHLRSFIDLADTQAEQSFTPNGFVVTGNILLGGPDTSETRAHGVTSHSEVDAIISHNKMRNVAGPFNLHDTKGSLDAEHYGPKRFVISNNEAYEFGVGARLNSIQDFVFNSNLLATTKSVSYVLDISIRLDDAPPILNGIVSGNYLKGGDLACISSRGRGGIVNARLKISDNHLRGRTNGVGTAIDLSLTTNSEVSNNSAYFFSRGVRAASGSARIKVSDNYLYGIAANPITIGDADDSLVTNNYIFQPGGPVEISGSGIKVSGNKIIDHGANGMLLGAGANLVVENNELVGSAAAKTDNATSARIDTPISIAGLVFTGNVLKSIGYGLSAGGDTLGLVKVGNNTFEDITNHAINLSGDAGTYCHIVANTHLNVGTPVNANGFTPIEDANHVF